MSFSRLLTRPVTILRPPRVEDRYHDQVPDWANATRTATHGWLAQVTSTEETTDRRDAQIAEWILYLPAGTDLTGRDRVQVDGMTETFELVGPPNRAHRRGGEHHLEAQLRTVEG